MTSVIKRAGICNNTENCLQLSEFIKAFLTSKRFEMIVYRGKHVRLSQYSISQNSKCSKSYSIAVTIWNLQSIFSTYIFEKKKQIPLFFSNLFYPMHVRGTNTIKM